MLADLQSAQLGGGGVAPAVLPRAAAAGGGSSAGSSGAAALLNDPVPAMRSLLRAVAHSLPVRRGGEGWALLRGVLSACAPRGVLSGPELALALARWAPQAFPSGVHEVWPYVVSMGVAHDTAIEVADFCEGLEGLAI